MEKVAKKIIYEFNNEEYELQDSIYMNTEGNERLSALINKNKDKVILIDKNDNILFEVETIQGTTGELILGVSSTYSIPVQRSFSQRDDVRP